MKVTRNATLELIRPTKEIAMPRTRFGNSSENSTHMIGPIDTAKLATKPSIANRISTGFMVIALLTSSERNRLYVSSPMVANSAERNSVSLS